MWNIGIGSIEIGLCLLMVPPMVFFRGVTRRWFGALFAITVLAVVSTPADPVSSLLVAAPLSIAFTLGVFSAPLYRQFGGVANPFNGQH